MKNMFAMLALWAAGVAALEITPAMEAQLSPQTSHAFERRQAEMGLPKSKLEEYTKVKIVNAEEAEEEEAEEGEDVFAELRASTREKMATHVKNKNSLSTLMMTGEEMDAMLYTDTFKPQPGHELYFDFDGFRALAKAQEAIMIEEFAKNTKIEHHTNNSVGALKTRSFVQACLEINICVNEPDATGVPNVCGQFGVNVAATYEQATGSDATLTFTGELNAGISFGVTNVFVTTFYLFGQVDWEFTITAKTPYTSVYGAIGGAFRALMMKMISARKVNKKFALRAKTVRDALVKEFEAAKMKSEAAKMPTITQTDEIRGLVLLHRTILTGYYNAIKPKTAGTDPTITFQDAQAALVKEVIVALWDKKPADLAKIKKGTFVDLITKAEKECVKSIKATEMSKQLFCSMLAYGALLEAPTKAWFGQGTRANMDKMMPELFAGAWPTDKNSLNAIVAVLEAYDTSVKAVTPTEWNTKVAQQIEFEEEEIDMKTKKKVKVKKFYTKVKDVKSIQQVNIDDPCRVARSFYQLLASPGNDLDKKIQANANLGPKSGDPVFKLTKITITGGVGATLGTSRVGYCTLDTNSIQARLAKTWTWTEATGWAGTGASLWVAVAFNSYFQIQLVWGFGAQESDAVKSGITYLGCLPNQKAAKADGSAGDMIISNKATDWLSTITAENVKAVGKALKTMIKNIYTAFKGKKKKEMGSTWTTLKTKLPAEMETGFTGVKTAMPADAKKVMPADFKEFIKSLFGTGIQALGAFLLKTFTGMELSTMMNFGLSINTLKNGKDQLVATISSTKIFKLELSKVNFYVIYGNEVEGEFTE